MQASKRAVLFALFFFFFFFFVVVACLMRGSKASLLLVVVAAFLCATCFWLGTRTCSERAIAPHQQQTEERTQPSLFAKQPQQQPQQQRRDEQRDEQTPVPLADVIPPIEDPQAVPVLGRIRSASTRMCLEGPAQKPVAFWACHDAKLSSQVCCSKEMTLIWCFLLLCCCSFPLPLCFVSPFASFPFFESTPLHTHTQLHTCTHTLAHALARTLAHASSGCGRKMDNCNWKGQTNA